MAVSVTITSRIYAKIKRVISGGLFFFKQKKPAREIFSDIYHNNVWGSPESRSGGGSDLVQTVVVRRELPALLEDFEITKMLDIPCGDWHWMRETNLKVSYIGADIVPEIIKRNQEQYGRDNCRFEILDMIQDELPKVDLIFSRDVLVHLSFEDIFAALNNMKHSGSTYLLTTTFTDRKNNTDIPTGLWRPLNLKISPFNFPEPIKIINENCTEGDGSWGDKCLALWKLSDLPQMPSKKDVPR